MTIAARDPYATPWRLVGLVILGRLIDVTTSVIAFSHGAGEANPLSRAAWDSGLVALVVQQALGLVAIGLLMQFLMGPFKRLGWTVCAIASWTPVVLNALLISGALRFGA
jgi:hypothetical protein